MAPGTAELKNVSGWTTDPSQYTLAPGSTNLGDTSNVNLGAALGAASKGMSQNQSQQRTAQAGASMVSPQSQAHTPQSGYQLLEALATLRNNRISQLLQNAQGGTAAQPVAASRQRGLLGM